jgi:hypothetical protein
MLKLSMHGFADSIFNEDAPLYLVSISAIDEPAHRLRKQLELLHGQVGS